MYVKHCFSACACALTLGLATGGYAQTATATHSNHHAVSLRAANGVAAETTPRFIQGNALSAGAASDKMPRLMQRHFGSAATSATAAKTNHYSLLSFNEALGIAPTMEIPSSNITTVLHQKPNVPQGRSLTGSAFYMNLPGTGTDPNTTGVFTTGAAAKGNALDDFDLPAGISGANGASLTTMTLYFGNFDTVVHDIFATVTFWDKLDYTNAVPAGSPVVTSRLAGYTFSIPAFPARTYTGQKLTLPAPLLLKHDIGTPGSYPYGIQLAFYTTAARTAFQNNVAFAMPLGQRVKVGHSEDVYYRDANQDGAFTPDEARVFTGHFPHLANFALELDGDSDNDLTYEFNGTLSFPTLSADGPINIAFQLHPHTVGAPDILIAGTLGLTAGPPDPVTGLLTGEVVSYYLTGIPADTYDVEIIPEGFAEQTTTADTLDATTMLNANVYGVDATFSAVASDVSGSIALEGVADLSATNPAAPLGNFNLSFRAPGTTTELFHRLAQLTTTAGSASGAYTVYGVPPATYDVRIKGSKNLAVLSPGVVVSATGAVPNVLLNGGDTNNDNQVDPTDFGLFVSAYNSSAATVGSGYDPKADFNYDGAVDPTDFNIFVGNYNTAGAP